MRDSWHARVVSRPSSALMLLAACGAERTGPPQAVGVGDSCWTDVEVPEGGFHLTQAYLQVGSLACRSEQCMVYHYRGDLIQDPSEGDGIAEQVEQCGEDCGWLGIEDRIYCTCKCGVTAGGDPRSIGCEVCPNGFECCPTFALGDAAGDYCVRAGTCER